MKRLIRAREQYALLAPWRTAAEGEASGAPAPTDSSKSLSDAMVPPPPTSLGKAVSNAQGANGQPYQFGGVDCSGYMSNIYNDLTGKSERFTTDSNFKNLGFLPGYDPGSHFNIGTNGLSGEQGHMAGELGGVPVESASATGHHPGATGVMYGGQAYGPQNPLFTQQYHLPNNLIAGNTP